MFDLAEINNKTNLKHVGDNAIIKRVICDSRKVQKGDLFVALKGNSVDASRFVPEAFAAGAAAAMVCSKQLIKCSGPLLLVNDDTRLGFGRLASWRRKNFDIPLVAITGSNGKTTVKEMVSTVLRDYVGDDGVLATEGNLNNDIGVPMTLVRLRPHHKYAVIEMGMNNKGEIGYLSKMASPTHGLINNAGAAHVGRLGTIEDVAKAKGELIDGLTDNGEVVLNMDDLYFKLWKKKSEAKRVTSFGLTKHADVTATYKMESSFSQILVNAFDEKFQINLKIPGVHNVRNAIAASAICSLLGVPGKNISGGLEKFKSINGRLRKIKLQKNIFLFDDSYNANPDSVKAAIEVLASLMGRKIFIMGEMGELGARAEVFHKNIGGFAKEKGIDRLIGVGALAEFAAEEFGNGGMHYKTKHALLKDIGNKLGENCNILIKGSRSAGLDEVVTEIINLCEN